MHCQSSAAKRWLNARQTQLLPVEYYHVVFTLPEEVAKLAFYNKAKMYDLLPSGFHRIRHYDLLSSKAKLKQSRQLLLVAKPEQEEVTEEKDEQSAPFLCRYCHAPIRITGLTGAVYRPSAPPN